MLGRLHPYYHRLSRVESRFYLLSKSVSAARRPLANALAAVFCRSDPQTRDMDTLNCTAHGCQGCWCGAVQCAFVLPRVMVPIAENLPKTAQSLRPMCPDHGGGPGSDRRGAAQGRTDHQVNWRVGLWAALVGDREGAGSLANSR